MPPRQHDDAWTNRNVAGGNASIGAQIGVLDGRTYYHDETTVHTTTYNINPADPPERRFAQAVKNLDADRARPAQQCFEDLLDSGYERPDLAYYYALSLFSDRAPGEVEGTIFDGVRRARTLALQYPNSDWHAAFQVIWEFVDCIWSQDGSGELDDEAVGNALRSFRGLPEVRQVEINRHLDLVLAGAFQESLDAIAAQRVAEERVRSDRPQRAWKFFEPPPAEPRHVDPEPTKIGMNPWVRIAVGALTTPLGLLAPLGGGNLGLGIPTLLLFLAGASSMLWFGVRRDTQVGRLARREREHGVPLQVRQAVSPGHWVTTAFVKEIHRRVDARFKEARPHLRGSWKSDTRGICEYVKERFVTVYGNSQVGAENLDWLIRWHARRVARMWSAGTLYAYRDDLRASQAAVALYHLGLAVAGMAAIAMLGAWGGFAVSGLVLGGGTLPAVRAVSTVLATRRCDREDLVRSRQLAEEERRAFTEWREVLSDQPSDSEIAQWLYLDKAHLKARALHRCAVASGELVSHAVLTQGRWGAGRARTADGPWRYQAYRVFVYLLTKSGVREVSFELDFVNGTFGDELRRSFRYDALASARVHEEDVRRRRRQVAGSDGISTADDRTLRSSTFVLSLLSGELLEVRAHGFSPVDDEPTDTPSRRRQVELVSAGIAGALHLLESVSAEGRHWLIREQGRRRHQVNAWQGRRLDLHTVEPDDPFGWS